MTLASRDEILTEDRNSFYRSQSLERSYSLYGRTVRSEIPLPIASSSFGGTSFDWAFRRRSTPPEVGGDALELARLRCRDHGNTIAARFQSRSGIWLQNPTCATFHISLDGTQVDVSAEDPYDENFVALALVSEVSIFLLQMRGIPTLHASAVNTPAGALVFLAPSGHGKSTIAASLLRRGFSLVTDDNLPLQLVQGQIWGGPSVPIMKVLDDTANYSSIVQSDSDCLTWGRKKVVPLDRANAFVDTPVAVRAVYVLNRYSPVLSQRSDVPITEISAQSTINTLLAQTAYGALYLPREVARFLPIYAAFARQIPVRLLTYPDGFENVDAVCDSVLKDVGLG